MKKQPKISEVATPAVQSYVRAYLMARAYSETMREAVDKVHAAILDQCPIYADLPGTSGERITKGKHLYLSTDEAKCADFYAEADKRLRACGLKPADMPAEYCPALVAENLLSKASRCLIDEAGKPFDLDADKLLCGGLKNWEKFIDLTVGLVVNLPGFKCELPGRVA